jgi:hypothetical protein
MSEIRDKTSELRLPMSDYWIKKISLCPFDPFRLPACGRLALNDQLSDPSWYSTLDAEPSFRA